MPELLGYDLINEEKLNRAVFGSAGREGKLEGGVGEGASDEVKLAAYDKLGGLIKKGENTVKMGSFYDFEKKAPRKTPEVLFVSRVDGIEITLTEEEAIALKKAQNKADTLKASKVKKVKKG